MPAASVVHFSFVRIGRGISLPLGMHFSFVRTKEKKKSRRLCLPGYSLLARAERHKLAARGGSDSAPLLTPSLRRPFHAREPRPGDGLPAGADRAETGIGTRSAARRGLPDISLPLGMHFSFVRTKEKMPKEKPPAVPPGLLPPCSKEKPPAVPPGLLPPCSG